MCDQNHEVHGKAVRSSGRHLSRPPVRGESRQSLIAFSIVMPAAEYDGAKDWLEDSVYLGVCCVRRSALCSDNMYNRSSVDDVNLIIRDYPTRPLSMKHSKHPRRRHSSPAT
jgi:hypothetical protein